MFKDGLLSGKRILITGGGTGLGLLMARRFAGLGASLVICGRRREVLEESALALRTEPTGTRGNAEVDVEVCDLRDPAQVEAMFDRLWEWGPLDVLVNNAAATFVARTERMSSRAIDAILGPTLHGAAYCTVAAGRRWIDAKHPGVVLSILSTSVRTGRAFTVPSAMAKSAVEAMTRSLAVEWGPHGIRLVAIAPGAFPTPGAARQLGFEARADALSTARRVPLGRNGKHAELADLAAYLVSDQAGYINGETIAIDGGAHLRTSGVEDLFDWTDAQWQAQRAQR